VKNAIQDLLVRCTFPDRPVVCAVSGGPDSIALLVLACSTGLDTTAVHVDHGIREGSYKEAEVVAFAAERFGAQFRSLEVHVEKGPNLEERARQARYGVLPDDVLTGHTADDQAETILLALLRGSAWHGLSGMEPSPQRPILQLRRAETVDLCASLDISTVSDPSNNDPHFRRNRIRHEALPLLSNIADRDLVPILSRQAELLRSGARYISSEAEKIDPTDSRALIEAPTILSREAIRNWIWKTRKDDHPPDLATIDRVLDVAYLRAVATDIGNGWRVARTDRILRIEKPETI
jgi:tRNA(Ile)-lysidine synthase